MPQQNLYQAPMARLIIEVDDGTLDLCDETRVTVRVARRDEEPWTLWASRLPGVASDYLDTLVQAACHAWAYGEEPRDVARACERVRKDALRHLREHGRA